MPVPTSLFTGSLNESLSHKHWYIHEERDNDWSLAVRITSELSNIVGTCCMLAMERNISITILLIIRIGPATTFLELATHADNNGMVVGIGTGKSNCFMLLSSMSSCIKRANSILIEIKPPYKLKKTNNFKIQLKYITFIMQNGPPLALCKLQ